MHGTVIPTNHLLPEGMPGYNKALTGPDGVTRAKQLLQEGMQEEGYSSVSQMPRITLTYFILDSDTSNLVAALAQRWETVLGVSVHLNLVDINLLLQQMSSTTGKAGPLQMWFLSFGNPADPQEWLSIIFGKGAAFNNMNYGQNTTSDAAAQQAVQDELHQADSNLNPTQRLQQYDDAEQKLANDVAWLPLFQVEQHYVVNPKLQNFPIHPLGILTPDEWSKVYFAQ